MCDYYHTNELSNIYLNITYKYCCLAHIFCNSKNHCFDKNDLDNLLADKHYLQIYLSKELIIKS